MGQESRWYHPKGYVHKAAHLHCMDEFRKGEAPFLSLNNVKDLNDVSG